MDEDDYEISVDSPPPSAHPGQGGPVPSGPPGLLGAGGGYAWEEEYKRSWDALQEDEDGSIASSVSQLTSQLKRKRLLRDTRVVQRGLVRHLVVVVDLSLACREVDFKPTRIDQVCTLLDVFLAEFFDQNPLAQVALVCTYNERAVQVTALSSHPGDHLRKVKERHTGLLAAETDPGEPSLQNALEMAMGVLGHVPAHGTREVLVLYSALTTCDPGNILDTAQALVAKCVRVSVVCLSAEIKVLKQVAQETRGVFSVAMHEAHLKELVLEHVPPPAIVVKAMARKASNLMRMGFPEWVVKDGFTLCACHGQPSAAGFVCPQCSAQVCAVPSECVVCGLTLVLSPHLARSYHHLFPVPNFVEVTDWKEVKTHDCAACMVPLPPIPTAAELSLLVHHRPTGRYKCPQCSGMVCLDCDVYIHDVLHNCPMCVGGTGGGGAWRSAGDGLKSSVSTGAAKASGQV